MESSAPSHGNGGLARGTGRVRGVGRLLIVVYGILALAATGRSFVQIATKFDHAPVAYLLSALSAVVYIVATVALVKRGRMWYRIAWATITFELLGVLVVGFLSIFDAELFPSDTVWSVFGRGYLFVPLVLPVLGMIWLSTGGRVDPSPATEPAAGSTTETAA
ncbi:hypothetical protein GCM10022239_23170 [Leifsonia bigeumensis]|uniref:Integral membrane protein n=1 Tax=Leifsonella bigeumensis TaxID=433643 RepID=A0ABP7FTM9_9MICO